MMILYMVIGLMILLLVITLFLPNTYHILRSEVIKAPLARVREKVGDLNQFKNWNPLLKIEPRARFAISGEPMKPGHRMNWNGTRIGAGRLTIRSADDQHIHFELEILRPWKSSASDNWYFEHWGENDTKVTWEISGRLPYPLARLLGPRIKRRMNRSFREGLQNLKRLNEEGMPGTKSLRP